MAGFIGDNNSVACDLAGTENGATVVKMRDGQKLSATLTNGSAHSGMTLAVRPEKLSLLVRGDSTYQNNFQARVVEKTYLGDRVRLTTSAFGNERIVASVPSVDGQAIYLGDDIVLGCHAKDCRLLAE